MSQQPTPEVDFNNMPMEELEALVRQAEAQGLPLTADEPAPAPAPAKADQPRDENGRFAKKEDDQPVVTDGEEEQPAPAPVATEEDEDGPYEVTIDLGEGAGPEVFRADTMQALVDLLAESKKHASRKIREQAEELRKLKELQKKAEADDEYVQAQQLLENPKQAVKRIVEETLAQRQQTEQQETDRKKQIVTNFLATHPDYEDEGAAGQKNGELMQKWMGSEFTAESFEKAYQTLKAKGFLELKGKVAHTGQEAPTQPEARIENKAEDKAPPQRTPVRSGSGISTRGRAPVVVKNEKKAEDMTDEELRQLAIKAWQ